MAKGGVVSVRLTSASREAIVAKMITHRFTKEASALSADYAALALAVYNDIYKPKDQKLIASLPKGWLPDNSALKIRFDSSGYGYGDGAGSGYGSGYGDGYGYGYGYGDGSGDGDGYGSGYGA